MIIASIDIGTNTVLLLVAEVDPVTKNIVSLENRYMLPRIGKDLKPGMPISQDKISILTEILTEYKMIADIYKCEHIIATATNAFRIASNSGKIVSYVKKKLNINIEIIRGEDEALFSFLGASGNYPSGGNNLVIDIGGGSTEIVYGFEDKVLYKKSFGIGAVSATESILHHAPALPEELKRLDYKINYVFNELKYEKFNIQKAIAIAGTPTTLACIKMNLKYFDEGLIEGSIITFSELKELVENLISLTPEQILLNFKDIVKGRQDILLSGSYILLKLSKLLNLDKVFVSTKGLRYGAVVNYINKLF